ncbi:unnamed protein product [Adineta steineri]|uniref:Secreted protein n=1 Tax=Adineta steineri TaxID=433720 RepID=A0A814YYG5_9BILA|nr:unnamed protein product [Adineta steineri]CAF1371832.1 unnamed protein product [Adineta steineri]CAF1485178.1 unnamed protein product [Adineta steineri]CAF3484341.1 unnamed protein product [Adineta steineri]CAF3703213.1 unnamed protein product [Adineta steineri]
MVEQASFIIITLIFFLTLFNKSACKTVSTGQFPSQRSRNSGGSSSGTQSQNPTHWSNSLLSSDENRWYDYGT